MTQQRAPATTTNRDLLFFVAGAIFAYAVVILAALALGCFS